MCFRPTSVAKPPKKCPECGQMNPGVAKVCIKCKTSLENLETITPTDK